MIAGEAFAFVYRVHTLLRACGVDRESQPISSSARRSRAARQPHEQGIGLMGGSSMTDVACPGRGDLIGRKKYMLAGQQSSHDSAAMRSEFAKRILNCALQGCPGLRDHVQRHALEEVGETALSAEYVSECLLLQKR